MTCWPPFFVTLNLVCLALGFLAGFLMAWGVRQWPRGPKPLSSAARRVLAGRER